MGIARHNLGKGGGAPTLLILPWVRVLGQSLSEAKRRKRGE